MGLIKKASSFAGQLSGFVLGAPIALIGDLTNSDMIRDIGKGVYHVTASTGEIIGRVAEGTVNCASGVIHSDSDKTRQGLGEIVDTATDTLVGMGKGVIHVADKGIETVEAIAHGDKERCVALAKDLVKIAAVSMISVGVADVLDGVADVDFDDADSDMVAEESVMGGKMVAERDGLDFSYGENAPQYWVNAPHTAAGGYYRTMPDGSVANNLSFMGK